MKIGLSSWPVSGVSSFEEFQKKIFRAPSAHLLVFPEYFSLELSSLSSKKFSNFKDLVKFLENFLDDFLKTLQDLSQRKNAIVIGGTFPVLEKEKIYNRAYVFTPQGKVLAYDKKILTPWEKQWGISQGEKPLLLLSPERVGLQICYEIEFPLPSRKLYEAGCEIVAVPSTTESLSGAKRVQVGALARALENQMAVAVAVTQGKAPHCFGLEKNRGRPALYLPPDLAYSKSGKLPLKRDGFWYLADLDLEKLANIRQSGETHNAKDWFFQNNS